jgi:hypothetical protein
MRVIDVPLGKIDIGERRRQDYGNIPALADGMRRVGLLEPIVVNENGGGRYHLVAGERRVRAAMMLQWSTIPASLQDHLSASCLRDMELEENENRKPLTEAERRRTFGSSKRLVENVKKAKEVLVQSAPKPSGKLGGRPKKSDSAHEVAEALGTSRWSIERAERHVETAERFPFLQSWRQAEVLKFDQYLKQLPPDEHAEFAAFLERNYAPLAPRPDQGIEVAEIMTVKTPESRAEIYELSKDGDARKRNLAATRARQRPPMPDPRAQILKDAARELRKACAAPYDHDPEAKEIREVAERTEAIRTGILSRYEDSKERESHAKACIR